MQITASQKALLCHMTAFFSKKQKLDVCFPDLLEAANISACFFLNSQTFIESCIWRDEPHRAVYISCDCPLTVVQIFEVVFSYSMQTSASQKALLSKMCWENVGQYAEVFILSLHDRDLLDFYVERRSEKPLQIFEATHGQEILQISVHIKLLV